MTNKEKAKEIKDNSWEKYLSRNSWTTLQHGVHYSKSTLSYNFYLDFDGCYWWLHIENSDHISMGTVRCNVNLLEYLIYNYNV